MGSSGKKRTTMAKLNRESKLRDKRAEKQARKTARKLTAARDAGHTASPSEHLRAGSVELDLGRFDSAERVPIVPASREDDQ